MSLNKENIRLRTWQKEAVRRSLVPLNKNESINRGIFLEAAGGRGKTICALAIAKKREAKSILVLNNRNSILKGWKETAETLGIEITAITDKKLHNLLEKGEKFNVDLLIIDEWQQMCSEKNVKNYKKIKRSYTIGLSATPIRRKGTNFYPLELTIFGEANPSNKWAWISRHGDMRPDQWATSGLKWHGFIDYETYIKNLPNFMDFDYIEKLEQAEENNGHKIKRFAYTIPCANPKHKKMLEDYNLVKVGRKSAMPKQSFGRDYFYRYINQAGIEVDFPKLKPVNKDTPTLLKVDELLEKAPHSLLVVTKSTQMAKIIKERNPHIDLWTGSKKEDSGSPYMVATQQVMGVGVDGLQERFKAILVLDPVDKDSGAADDYRQLLWRITGSRQKHDVTLIEFYYE